MVALEWAREPSGFALRLRFEPFRIQPAPKPVLGTVAYAAIALVVLALATEPLGPSWLPAYRPADAPAPAREADVLHAVRPVLTLDRADLTAVQTVVVSPDDTLFSLADRFAVTPQTIAFNNGLADSASLRVGQVLRVPAIDAALYVVQDGDTVESVAARFGAAADALVAVDRLLYEPQNFRPGATLVVPVPDGRFPGFRLKVTDESRPAPLARTLTRARLLWPVPGIVTQRFASYHTGVDLAAPYGTAVVSADAGTVEAVGLVNTGGLRVCVRHDWGLRTCYYHLSATLVVEGQRVGRGEPVGRIGLTGVTTGPHVHWEASVEGAFVDPLSY